MMRAHGAALTRSIVALGSLSACQRQTPPSPAAASADAASAHALTQPLGACRDNSECPSDAYCTHEPGLCGRGPAPGVCRPRGSECSAAEEPVCGCDGQIHASAAVARCRGVDLDVTGGCRRTVAGRAACGAHYCDAATSYCEIYLSDVFELPSRHTCRPLPERCRSASGLAPDCSCFPADTPCLSFCGPMLTGADASGRARLAFHLTCQGVKEPLPQR